MRRRSVLKTLASAGLAGWLADTPALRNLAAAVAQDGDVSPDIVRLDGAIEPLVRLIETTPRDECFDMATRQLRQGTPYRQLMAALYLAGIRNVNPQPPGFKFHCVFVIHAAHQLSLDGPVEDRLLPFFWALDNFKQSQAEDLRLGDFRLAPVQGRVPSPSNAWDEFHAAMDEWDEERADRAIVALVRSRGAHEIAEGLWRYGARDYRNIGHKAIFVANTWRTLQTIGWRHAEPALRSLVLGLLDFGREERVNDFAFEDQTFLANQEIARQAARRLPEDWMSRDADAGATRQLLDRFRSSPLAENCRSVVQELEAGRLSATSAWDAAHLWAGELMMRQPGIYGIHTVTSINGLRYAYEMGADTDTRLLMLLQAIGWMGQFQQFMHTRNDGLQEVRITELEPAELGTEPDQAVQDILTLTSMDRRQAAAKALSFPVEAEATERFARQAYRLIFRKGTDAHDYKYAAAIFEDLDLVSSAWRPQMLATSVYHLLGTRVPDSPLMTRAVEAVRRLS
jgi:hypothetical protein